MRAHELIVRLHVRRRLVVLAEDAPVQVGVLVAGFRVCVETQRLVILDRERRALGDVRLVHLRAPIAMIAAHDLLHGVVQQTREHDVVIGAALQRFVGALEAVVARALEAQREEVLQRGGRGQRRQPLDLARWAVVVEQRACAAAIRPRGDLRLDLRGGRKFDRRRARGGLRRGRRGASGTGTLARVELREQRFLEGVGAGFVAHEADGRRAAEPRNESTSIEREHRRFPRA